MHIVYHDIKISQQNIEHISFYDAGYSFYREKLNENRFVILIYYECRYAQFALSSVIELPRIPAYYPKTTLLELPIPVKALFRPVLMPPIIGLLTIRKAKKLTN